MPAETELHPPEIETQIRLKGTNDEAPDGPDPSRGYPHLDNKIRLATNDNETI